MRYGDAWDQLRERLFAEFWCLPDAAYDQILADTADWIEAQPDGRDTIVETRPYLSADLFRKPGSWTAGPIDDCPRTGREHIRCMNQIAGSAAVPANGALPSASSRPRVGPATCATTSHPGRIPRGH